MPNKKQHALTDKQINLVFSLYSSDKIDEAIAKIQALNIQYPNVPLLFNILGACYQKLEQYDLAVQMFKNAIAIKSDYAEAHNNCGIVQKKLGNLEESILSFKLAISHLPNYLAAHYNLGNSLKQLGRFNEAVLSYRNAIKIKPDFAEALHNLGIVYSNLDDYIEAVESYKRAIEFRPNYVEAYNNLAIALRKLNRLDEALSTYEELYKIDSNMDLILGNIIQIKKELCIWNNLSSQLHVLLKKINDAKLVTTPWMLLGVIDDPKIHKLASSIFCKNIQSNVDKTINSYPRHKKIRLGYFSADFHNHATMHLMAELFEKHNKNLFQIYAFSFGPNKQDIWRERAISSFYKFIDVSSKTDQEITQLAIDMEIDIAIDLKGYTQDSRPRIFKNKCAPLQVNYLGYPGTLGSGYMDYIIADETIIPKDSQKYYSEKIIYMPDTYQVNQTNRLISQKLISKKDLGIKNSSFVFCSFNNSYKISPDVFESWMRILNAVEDSILWLLVGNKHVAKNLASEAAKLGVNKSRLVFAEYVPIDEHLNRIKCADLFIDTNPYNAHTTCSDALRMGLPVLTKLGNSFASRVSASLLKALDLTELITFSKEEYEFNAIDLAKNPKRLKKIKNKLAKNLTSSTIYDSTLFAKHIESAYQIIYERSHQRLKPENIYVENQGKD